ncbi:hypothetical protein GCM10010954_09110 [Halobacillus andaensis]|uniref:Uncharacterized protein n=1 Tax=Halobacillus andaensis TaxID=1176239 RepID=A0A917AZN8_HALAA|nr:hypothetical protein [Halobacillus andaensis]MBP2003701.1 hypothetical protein [Halobacillus andaensis]GGF12568.1 hypothetical protein GCM10010954_09110 [Halobacillus andaensis]
MTIHFFVYTIDVSIQKKKSKSNKTFNKDAEENLLNRKAAYRNLY